MKLAILHTDGWGGHQMQSCWVVAETPKRFRIRALNGGELRLPFRRTGVSKIYSPDTALVPKYAIEFVKETA